MTWRHATKFHTSSDLSIQTTLSPLIHFHSGYIFLSIPLSLQDFLLLNDIEWTWSYLTSTPYTIECTEIPVNDIEFRETCCQSHWLDKSFNLSLSFINPLRTYNEISGVPANSYHWNHRDAVRLLNQSIQHCWSHWASQALHWEKFPSNIIAT